MPRRTPKPTGVHDDTGEHFAVLAQKLSPIAPPAAGDDRRCGAVIRRPTKCRPARCRPRPPSPSRAGSDKLHFDPLPLAVAREPGGASGPRLRRASQCRAPRPPARRCAPSPTVRSGRRRRLECPTGATPFASRSRLCTASRWRAPECAARRIAPGPLGVVRDPRLGRRTPGFKAGIGQQVHFIHFLGRRRHGAHTSSDAAGLTTAASSNDSQRSSRLSAPQRCVYDSVPTLTTTHPLATDRKFPCTSSRKYSMYGRLSKTASRHSAHDLHRRKHGAVPVHVLVRPHPERVESALAGFAPGCPDVLSPLARKIAR